MPCREGRPPLAEKPDLVVLEAMLPKLHGFDLTQKISRETQGRVPVVLISPFKRGLRTCRRRRGPRSLLSLGGSPEN